MRNSVTIWLLSLVFTLAGCGVVDKIYEDCARDDCVPDHLLMDTQGRHGMFTPAPVFLDTPKDFSISIPEFETLEQTATREGRQKRKASYDQGFRDGCNTSLGITGSGLLRNHGFSYDVNRGIEDQEYYKGYRIGTIACVYYVDYDIL